jgi:hypothetical protein
MRFFVLKAYENDRQECAISCHNSIPVQIATLVETLLKEPACTRITIEVEAEETRVESDAVIS